MRDPMTSDKDMGNQGVRLQDRRRGLLRRFLDWLLWDGEDEVEVEVEVEVDVGVETTGDATSKGAGRGRKRAQQVAAAPRRGRVVQPRKAPRRHVDSIDWEAFAEGRPQTESRIVQAVRATSDGASSDGVPSAGVDREGLRAPSVATVMSTLRWQA